MWIDFSTSSTMMMLVTQWEIGLRNENKTKNQTNKHIVCIWYFQSNLVIVAWYSSLLMWVIIFWIARLLPEIGSTINSNHPCQVKLFQIFDLWSTQKNRKKWFKCKTKQPTVLSWSKCVIHSVEISSAWIVFFIPTVRRYTYTH